MRRRHRDDQMPHPRADPRASPLHNRLLHDPRRQERGRPQPRGVLQKRGAFGGGEDRSGHPLGPGWRVSRRGELEVDAHSGIGGEGEQGRVAAMGEVEVTAAGVRAGQDRLTLGAGFENEPAGVGPEPCPEHAPQPPPAGHEPAPERLDEPGGPVALGRGEDRLELPALPGPDPQRHRHDRDTERSSGRRGG